MPALCDLYDSIKKLCDHLFALRHSPRPGDADWRHHRPSLESAQRERDECRAAADACLSMLDLVKGELPVSWLEGEPSVTKYIRLKRSLERVNYWLHEFQKPFRGFKMPIDRDQQDQHDDPADISDWEAAECTVRTLGCELRNEVEAKEARSAQANNLTPSQHAQLGCDYLDELLNDLESHDWCWMGALRGGAYERMVHSVSGIGFKFNEHAKALGLPLVFGGEVKKISEEQTDFWLKIVDPVKGGQSSTLTATLHQPKGANHTIKPYPFDPPGQCEFRDFIARLKRELRRRAGLGPEPPVDNAPPSDASVLWRKLLHHVREYQKLLSQSDAWNYGREDEINKHAQSLRLHPPFRRYEEHNPNAMCGTWLEVWDVWKSESEAFPIIALAGNEIRPRVGTKPHVLALLETWASKATAELEAAPMAALPQRSEMTQCAQAEPDLSDVLEGMDDEHGLPLPELARQIADLAVDAEAGITESLRHNAAELSKSARLQFRDTSMERREVEPGRCEWVKRNPANRLVSERRSEHHLSQVVAVLSDLQDGRRPADTATKLRAIAKGIESNTPRPADPEPLAAAEPLAMPDDPGNAKPPIESKGSKVTPDPVAVAVTMKVRDPKLTVRKAAQAVGMHYTVLQKDRTWQAAVYRLRQQAKGNVRSGSKSADGQIETSTDDDEQDAEE